MSEAGRPRLDANFVLRQTFDNPCGAFGGQISFGADSDLIRIDCKPPDMRTAVSNGMNGTFGEVLAPVGTPGGVGYDVRTGREIARVDVAARCSPEVDAFELALGRGFAAFYCYEGATSPTIRILSDGRDGAPVARRNIAPEIGLVFMVAGRMLVRQPTIGREGEPMGGPEIADPLRPGELEWRRLDVMLDKDACARAVAAAMDGRRLMMSIGHLRDIGSDGVSVPICEYDAQVAVDVAGFSATAPFSRDGDGWVPRLAQDNRSVVPLNRGGAWSPEQALATVTGPSGDIQLAFQSGPNIAPWRYSGVDMQSGEGLLAAEIAPRLRIGHSPFLYLIYDWDGEPLARFHATRIALAPDRARIVVISGRRIEVWDRIST